MVENPWTLLSQNGKEYLLEIDRGAVAMHNHYASEYYKFHLNLLPEPYIGNLNANVIALNANPGMSPEDDACHSMPACKRLFINNLLHNYENKNNFYYLSPEFDRTPGARWWRQRLRCLTDQCGNDAVSKNLFVIELMGYHSQKYKYINLPSQKYSCQLVKNAMDRGAVIIIMSSKREWYQLVPGLENYKNCHILNNPQATYFSPNNLENFKEIVNTILSSG